MHPPPAPWSQNVSGGNVGVSQRNTVLNRNRRLLLWWSRQKKDVNDVNLQFDNGQSGHGRIAPPPWIRHCVVAVFAVRYDAERGVYRGSQRRRRSCKSQ